MNALKNAYRKLVGQPTQHWKQGTIKFDITEDGLKRTSPCEDLDDLYLSQRLKPVAKQGLNELAATAKKREAWMAQDQSSGDADHRTGHIVLPKEEVEYHPDSDVWKHPESERFLSSNKVNIKPEGRHLGADWQQATDVDRYSPIKDISVTKTDDGKSVKVQYKMIAREGEQRLHLFGRRSGEFQANPEGRVIMPAAQILSDAHKLEKERKIAARADDLLSAALMWEEKVLTLDQSDQDYNPNEGNVILYQVKDKPSNPISRTGGRFEVGYKDGKLTMYGDSYTGWSKRHRTYFAPHRGPGTNYKTSKFTMERTDQEVNLKLHNLVKGKVEKVQWNLSENTVHYQSGHVDKLGVYQDREPVMETG